MNTKRFLVLGALLVGASGGVMAQEREAQLCAELNDKDSFESMLGRCKAGDIITVGGITGYAKARVCDFSKAMISDNGKVTFCIYIGYMRHIAK